MSLNNSTSRPSAPVGPASAAPAQAARRLASGNGRLEQLHRFDTGAAHAINHFQTAFIARRKNRRRFILVLSGSHFFKDLTMSRSLFPG